MRDLIIEFIFGDVACLMMLLFIGVSIYLKNELIDLFKKNKLAARIYSWIAIGLMIWIVF